MLSKPNCRTRFFVDLSFQEQRLLLRPILRVNAWFHEQHVD